MKLENVIYCGDNLIWLKQFPDKCIDLIYLDPPFFSNKKYEVIFNDSEEYLEFEKVVLNKITDAVTRYPKYKKILRFSKDNSYEKLGYY